MALTKVTGHVVKPDTNIQVHNTKSTGIVTFTHTSNATSSTTGALQITGGVGIVKDLHVGGNVTVGGTLTYDDVTNIDSLGIITARAGINVIGHSELDNVSISGVATITSTAPELHLTDTNANSDYSIVVNGGEFRIRDETNSANRFYIASNGNANFTSNLVITGAVTTGDHITLSGVNPRITFTDSNHNPDYELYGSAGNFKIWDSTSNVGRLVVNSDGHVDIPGNLDCGAGIDVTGNANVSGDLDVDGQTDLDDVSIAGVTTFSNATTIVNGGYHRGIINSGAQAKIIGGYISGSDTLRLGESMYLTTTGLGIGEPSPGSYSSGAYNLVISSPSGSNSGITINSASGGTDSGAIFFSHGTASGANGVGRIRYYHSDDHMDFWTANTPRLHIASDGKIFVANEAGTIDTTARLGEGNTFQLSGLSSNDGISVVRYNSSYGAWGLNLGRSKSNTLGTNVALQDNDDIGHVTFWGADGGDFNKAAQISAEVDGTPSNGTDMPGALVFKTSAEASGTPSDRLRITSYGALLVGTDAALYTGGDVRHEIRKDVARGYTAQNMVAHSHLLINNSNTGTDRFSSIGFRAGTGDGAIGFVYTNSVNSADFVVVTDGAANGTERLRITNTGNIAIQTNGAGLSGAGTLRINSGSTAGALNLDGGATNHGGEINLTGGSNGGRIQFRTGQGSGQQDEKMRLDENGRLLIGTTNANNAFTGGDDIIIGNTNSGTRSGITFVSNSSEDGGIYFSDGTSSGNAHVQGQIVYDHSGHYLRLYSSADEKVRILGGTTDHVLQIRGGNNLSISDYAPNQTFSGTYNGFHTDNHGNTLIGLNAHLHYSSNSGTHQWKQTNAHNSIGSAGMFIGGNGSGNNTDICFFRNSQGSSAGTVFDQQSWKFRIGDSITQNFNQQYLQRGFFKPNTNSQNANNFPLAASGIGGYAFGYQEAFSTSSGSWVHPYPNLVLGYHTGIMFGGNTGYGGMRFFADHPSSNNTLLFSVGNGNTNCHVVNSLSKGGGSFRIAHPHPSKKYTHDLVHSFIEGPQCDNIYRGKVDLVAGSASINIDTVSNMTDGTFVLLNRDIQCFTSNETGWTAVKGSVSGNILTITAQDNSCTDTISWMVIGERQDDKIKSLDMTDDNGDLIVEPLTIEETHM